jgi:hypothetical protein
MTNKKEQLAQIFDEAWHNPKVEAKDLPTYILEQLISQGLATPDSVLNDEGVRKSYENLSEAENFDYTNYRKRPRKVSNSMVFEFKKAEPATLSLPPMEEMVSIQGQMNQVINNVGMPSDF